ncbi:hypothetical protein EV643_1712 [Kribbella sp. VKM Ac-2527]|uniref:Uncharacterized protein n=1 Tax=Kribbella caucasensis TaxID=2512215 RepID=A0A4R6IUW4_9ACTN|nr:hypothetical protein [Kribbella sp. VKM Ac-2527]TDO26131.1 hypothetical protein EV643_1712 [Kribbella sp. VKM Ac-2527]
MTSDPAGFYGATAQTIPVLLLVLAVETTFLARAAHSNAVRRRLEAWADSGQFSVPGFIDFIPLASVLWETIARYAIRALAQPIGRLANSAFVFGTLFLSLAAELLAFVGLATDPGSTFVAWSVGVTLVAVSLLLIETLWALGGVVVVGTRGQPQLEPPMQPPIAGSPPDRDPLI